MANSRPQVKVDGDQEALLFILAVVVGAGAWVLIGSLVSDPVLGEALGFLGMCAAMFPFARRTWAANLSVWRYCETAMVAMSIATALRLIAG